MDYLKVKIISPRRVIFEGLAESVSSTNSKGDFDVLPGHANFISVVENKPIIVRLPTQKTAGFQFPLAIVFVNSNNVNIYTDINFEMTSH